MLNKKRLKRLKSVARSYSPDSCSGPGFILLLILFVLCLMAFVNFIRLEPISNQIIGNSVVAGVSEFETPLRAPTAASPGESIFLQQAGNQQQHRDLKSDRLSADLLHLQETIHPLPSPSDSSGKQATSPSPDITGGKSLEISSESLVIAGVFKKYNEPAKSLKESLQRKVFPNTERNPDSRYLHGKVGIDERGVPLWKPRPLPGLKMTFEQKTKAHEGYCFNTRVSDSLPLDRDVPDYNHQKCHERKYSPDLPPASVIITFHNENLSVLLRSIHSILNKTPPSLLKEIILVDDFSNSTSHPWLYEQLDDYVQYLPKTAIMRLTRRRGLMLARIAGMVSSEILISQNM